MMASLPNPNLADLMRIVRDAILRQWPDLEQDLIAADGAIRNANLFHDLGFDGADLLAIAELLEEELGVQLWPADLIDIAAGSGALRDLAMLLRDEPMSVADKAG